MFDSKTKYRKRLFVSVDTCTIIKHYCTCFYLYFTQFNSGILSFSFGYVRDKTIMFETNTMLFYGHAKELSSMRLERKTTLFLAPGCMIIFCANH